jgi:hypothetical protein
MKTCVLVPPSHPSIIHPCCFTTTTSRAVVGLFLHCGLIHDNNYAVHEGIVNVSRFYCLSGDVRVA